MKTKELNNIEQFVTETFNEEEMMEIKGGYDAVEAQLDHVNNGTGCGCNLSSDEFTQL